MQRIARVGYGLSELDGVAKDISYDLSNVFNSSNNKPGRLLPWRKNRDLSGWNAICPKGTSGKYHDAKLRYQPADHDGHR